MNVHCAMQQRINVSNATGTALKSIERIRREANEKEEE